MEWQLIETAPKTQDQILTYRNKLNGATFGVKSENWYQASFWSDKHKLYVGWPLNIQPTHWMPLPEAPK